MLHWVKQHLWWVTGFSILLFVVGLLIAFLFVLRMPADYFVRTVPKLTADDRLTTVRVLRRIVKNILGIVVLLTGVVLSLPMVLGPGLLLTLIGLSLTDFPGKRALELRIVRNPLVLHTVNKLRHKYKRRPLQLPPRH